MLTNPLTFAENALATPISIPALADASYPSSALTVTALPSVGIIVLANGLTPVTLGETLSVQQLTGLKFRPALNSFGVSSSLVFTVSDRAANTASAAETLSVGPSTTPVVTTRASLSVPKNSPATLIGISASVDANYGSSQLSVKVTALPADGTVLLSNGTTPVTVGEALTVAHLRGLEFVRTSPAFFGQSSSFGASSVNAARDLSTTVATPTVEAGSVLQIDDPVPNTEMIQFGPGYGTLQLDAPSGMAGTISGFTGTDPSAIRCDRSRRRRRNPEIKSVILDCDK